MMRCTYQKIFHRECIHCWFEWCTIKIYLRLIKKKLHYSLNNFQLHYSDFKPSSFDSYTWWHSKLSNSKKFFLRFHTLVKLEPCTHLSISPSCTEHRTSIRPNACQGGHGAAPNEPCIVKCGPVCWRSVWRQFFCPSKRDSIRRLAQHSQHACEDGRFYLVSKL